MQVSSAIFTISHYDLSEFVEYDQDVYFVMYNVFNDFFDTLRHSSELYVEDLH